MNKEEYLEILREINEIDEKLVELSYRIEIGSCDLFTEYMSITNDDYDFNGMDRDDLNLDDYDDKFIMFRDRFTHDSWRMPVDYLDEEYRQALIFAYEKRKAKEEQVQADLDRECKEQRRQLYLTLKQEFES